MTRHREQIQRFELLAGIIASTIVNHSFSPPKKAVSPGDFMPSEWSHRVQMQEPRPPRLNRKRVAQNVRFFLMRRIDKPA